MLQKIAPLSITIARMALVISVGLTVIAVVTDMLSIPWAELPSSTALGGIIVVSIGSLLTAAYVLWPLWLIHRGSRLAAPVATIYALIRTVFTLVSIDVVSAIIMVIVVTPAVLLWLPDSRSYLRTVRAERAEARTQKRPIAFN